MLENVLKDLLKIRLMNILENYDNGVDDILNIVNDINSYDAHLEDLRYYDNDSYFLIYIIAITLMKWRGRVRTAIMILQTPM